MYGVVTMRVPSKVYCPPTQPDCDWMLYVNEPDIPPQPVVGYQIAAAGSGVAILEVKYPSDFCGVIQADALVGPSPWLREFGHQMMINTCDTTTTSPPTTSPPTTSAPTTSPPTTSPPTTAPRTPTTTPPHTAATSALPFTGDTSPAGDSSSTDPVGNTTATTAPASLPFTGSNLKPLVILGVAMILAGLYLLSNVEQRRRALRRLGSAVSTGADYSSRASHWFLGE